MKPFLHFILLLILVSFISCSQPGKESTESVPGNQPVTGTGIKVADPIIYDALIKNPDPEDRWGTEELKGFDRKKLVNLLFKAVYEGKATAYNYHTDEPMSIEEIKAIEASDEFDRSKIGKIQFVEDWYFDPKTMHMTKVVKSIMLAYEVYNQFDQLRGYKAAFRIKLK